MLNAPMWGLHSCGLACLGALERIILWASNGIDIGMKNLTQINKIGIFTTEIQNLSDIENAEARRLTS